MRFLIDEDFDNRIFRGLLRAEPSMDIIRVQDTVVSEADDLLILDWAARQRRILFSHDVNTMSQHFLNFLRLGRESPGLILVPQSLAVGAAIQDILLIAHFSVESEYQNQMIFLPLK